MSLTEKPAPEKSASEKSARTRAARVEVDGERRRRRDPNDNSTVKRLGVNESKLDRSQYQYRWVNDTPGRIDMLYRQDWDQLSADDLGGEAPERHADVAQNRVALTSRLMRKPRDLYEEDHAVRQKATDEEMKAAELGRTVLNGPGGNDGLAASDPRVYAPNPSSNKL